MSAQSTTQTRSPLGASLYVGELAPEVNEKDLFDFFTANSTAKPASVKVCRDHTTRRSLGYGYVNFSSMVDAERALDIKNNEIIMSSSSNGGKPCRIMWSQRDPALRRSGVGNLYVGNLDSYVTTKDLSDFFSQFGDILSSKVVTDEKGLSKGYGFVHFENVESSERALQKAVGYKLGTKEIIVSKHIPYRERQIIKSSSWTNVYVKNLASGFTEEDLTNLFSTFGTITSVYLRENTHRLPDSEQSDLPDLKFGFVNFEKHEQALKATEQLNGKEERGLILYVAQAQTKRERENELRRRHDKNKEEKRRMFQDVNLFVKNLEDHVDEAMLRSVFGQYGKIQNVHIKKDAQGRPAGFGFVCFCNQTEADAAIQNLNTRILDGSQKPLYVAHHQPKEVRQNTRAFFGTPYPYPHYPYPYPYAPGPIPFQGQVPQRIFPMFQGVQQARVMAPNGKNARTVIPKAAALPSGLQNGMPPGHHYGAPPAVAPVTGNNTNIQMEKAHHYLVSKNVDPLVIGTVLSELTNFDVFSCDNKLAEVLSRKNNS